MTKLDLEDVHQRGIENFDALSEVEKNLYVILLFFLLYEMEGILHFYLYSVHLKHLPRLLEFMAAIRAPNYTEIRDLSEFLREKCGGTLDVNMVDKVLDNISAEENANMEVWDKGYYAKTQEMGACARNYVRQRYGVEFD